MVSTIDKDLNNELNVDKFRLVFNEIKATELLCTSASIPGLDGQPIEMGNPNNKIYVQGKKLNYTPLSLTFKVDEDLHSFKEVYSWMLHIYAPQKAKQFLEFQQNLKIPNFINGTRFGFDATLFSLKNSNLPNIEIQFMNLFPTSLSSIDFTYANEGIVLTTAQFQYDYYLFK